MKIYLDYILLENIIVNIVIIYQVGIFTKSKINITRNLVSSIILAIYTTLIYVINDSFVNSIIIKLMIVNVVMYIAFKPKNLNIYLKKVVYYYIISFIYVGVIIGITAFFNISISNTLKKICIYIVSGIITYLFNNYLWKMWKTNIKKDNLVYTIKINDQEIQCYVDTGNLVHENIYNLDVIFIDYKWFGVLELLGALENKIDIQINTVSDNSKVFGYIVKNVEVYKNKKYICKLNKIIFSFSNQRINIDNKYSALIGYDLYLEKLKGVIL